MTLLAKLDHHARTRPDATAVCHRVGDAWTPITWSEHRRNIRRFARALLALGLEKGDTVGILGFNRPEWPTSLIGTMAAGGAGAGIYTTNSPDQVRFILDHARSRVVVVENAHQLAKVEEVRSDLPRLEKVVVMDGSDARGDAVAWDDFLASGDAVSEERLDEVLAGLLPEDLATLIYTSGTTGRPKAVMLSHGNIVETVRVFQEMFSISSDDICFSYLPLAHVAEQMNSVLMPTSTGAASWFAQAPETVPDDLRATCPTIFFAVPRVWEKFMSAIAARLAEAPPLRRALARWAMDVCRRVTILGHQGKKPGTALALRHTVARRLTRKIRAAIGLDRTHLAASGAAPIGRDVLEFFAGLELSIYEVWGLSETSGPATWNRPGQIRLGTVGRPIHDCEVRVADDGEVQVRGPNVFQGYLHNPEATAEVLDGDGWFSTGDMGSFDGDGYLLITGRKKALIITSGGKNIGPEGIEKSLKESDLVADAVVVGDRRPFLGALLSLDAEGVERFYKEHGRPAKGGEPHEDARIYGEVEAHIEAVNRRVSRVEQVRAFRLLPRNLSIEDGELTPTMKVKRDVVHATWSGLIDDMYDK